MSLPEQHLTEEQRKGAMGNQSVFQRLKAHSYNAGPPVITPIYSNQKELTLGGFTNEQIISIQHQLAPVVQSGGLRVRALGAGVWKLCNFMFHFYV